MTLETADIPLLQVRNLGLRYLSASGPVPILHDVSFELGRGEILGIIGESGAGKSTLGNAIIGLLASGFHQVTGTIEFGGKAIHATDGSGSDSVRGRRISAVFQDHTASLDPLMSVGAQLEETILATNKTLSRREAHARALELMARVGIPEPSRRYRNYPHQFSGGQRQRVVIAIALAGSPDIIVADEPTSALDATVQKQILGLLRNLVDETHVSIILVTHDMGVISEIADRVLVMRNGQVVEQGVTAAILDAPQNEYTRSLLAAVPRLRTSKPVPEETGGTRITPSSECGRESLVLAAEGVSKTFSPQGLQWGRLQRTSGFALRNVNIRIARGTITGIVGESGSGKSTIGRIIAGLDTAPTGRIRIDDSEFDVSRNGRRTGLLGRVQMIFQDPAVSLNPRMTVGETLRESIRFGAGPVTKGERSNILAMMDRLGLARSLADRHPHQLSGGQKQRVAIARALLARPEIVIADEPTSALDVSVQAEIVQLLKESITEQNISMIFISHDLALVQDLCSAVYIFRDGRVEDFGPSDFIFSQSQNPYTRSLIDARPHRFTH